MAGTPFTEEQLRARIASGPHIRVVPQSAPFNSVEVEVVSDQKHSDAASPTPSAAAVASSAPLESNAAFQNAKKDQTRLGPYASRRRLSVGRSLKMSRRVKRSEERFADLLRRFGASFRNRSVEQKATNNILVKGHNTKLIKPDSMFRRVWDIMIILFVFYNAVAIPYSVVFISNPLLSVTILEYAIDLTFIIDVFLNFCTAYIDEDRVLILDRKMVAKRYLKTWFTIDLFASLPFEIVYLSISGANWVTSGTELKLIGALKCLRLFRLGRVFKMMTMKAFSNLFAVGRLYLFIILLVHWMSCAWYLLVDFNLHNNPGRVQPWLVEAGIAEMREEGPEVILPAIQAYLRCFAANLLMLFRTMPYRPVTTGENFFYTLAVLFGSAIHASIFGQVVHLVNSMYSDRSRYKRALQNVYNRMSYFKIPPSLQGRIHLYFESLWERQKVVADEPLGEEALVQNLSEPLKKEVQMYLYRDMIEKVPMFQGVGYNVVLQVIENLESHLFLPGDYVVRRGEVGDRMYFIRKGECRVLLSPLEGSPKTARAYRRPSVTDSCGNALTTAKVLKAGDYFGELGLILRMPRTATICSMTFSELSSLGYIAFGKILAENPDFRRSVEAGFSRYFPEDQPEDSDKPAPGPSKMTKYKSVEEETNLLRRDLSFSVQQITRPGSTGVPSPATTNKWRITARGFLERQTTEGSMDTAPEGQQAEGGGDGGAGGAGGGGEKPKRSKLSRLLFAATRLHMFRHNHTKAFEPKESKRLMRSSLADPLGNSIVADLPSLPNTESATNDASDDDEEGDEAAPLLERNRSHKLTHLLSDAVPLLKKLVSTNSMGSANASFSHGASSGMTRGMSSAGPDLAVVEEHSAEDEEGGSDADPLVAPSTAISSDSGRSVAPTKAQHSSAQHLPGTPSATTASASCPPFTSPVVAASTTSTVSGRVSNHDLAQRLTAVERNLSSLTDLLRSLTDGLQQSKQAGGRSDADAPTMAFDADVSLSGDSLLQTAEAITAEEGDIEPPTSGDTSRSAGGQSKSGHSQAE